VLLRQTNALAQLLTRPAHFFMNRFIPPFFSQSDFFFQKLENKNNFFKQFQKISLFSVKKKQEITFCFL